MAREKQGYRDALERIRHEAAGELVTVAEAAHIVYGTDPQAARNPAQSMQLEEETPGACRRYAAQAAKTEKGDQAHENDL